MTLITNWRQSAVQEQTRFYITRIMQTIAVLTLFCATTLCLLLERAIAASPAATGTMELVCLPPVGLDIHLDILPDKATLLLHIWATPVRALSTKRPTAVTGTWCDAEHKCRDIKGSIYFRHLNLEQRASGTYDIELEAGQVQQGSFVVVRRPQKKPFLCE
jgi:hypothetical protein